ncbi:monocarboxylate transporter 13-like [Branchiostoma floridae]|uniref:Monocarboxylate transporter 13-like n=2 Tax=Branchiostoma floridae TaxID=7739 RepID=A0A9J7M3Y6_BRAFL|nr:monocarboxylate transporter 13-like [Branchiostoma floridae]
MKHVQYLEEAPDGGWGWFVVLSSFLCHLCIVGVAKSFGVFFPYFLEAFGEDARSTSWVSSIQGATCLFGSVFAGALTNVFGCRAVVMMGSLIAAAGLISSFFITSLPAMYLTTGFITGVGFALMYTPCLTMVGRYFKKRRALANGLGVTGTGPGTFILPPFFQYIIDQYGWRGALLVTAGVALQGLVFGALLRPIYLKEDLENHSARAPQDKSMCLTRLFDFSLFKTPIFVIFALSNIFLFFANFIPYVHLVAHARHVGIDAQKAAFLISVIGIGDGVSRIAYGWLSDLGLFVRLRGYIVCLLGFSLSLLCLPVARTYPAMIVCCLCFGVFAGCYTTQTAVFVAEFCGVKRLASAIGLLYSLGGLPTLFGPPIAGYLYDVTGNYDASFYTAGSAVLCSVLLMTPVEIFLTRTAHSRGDRERTVPDDIDIDLAVSGTGKEAVEESLELTEDMRNCKVPFLEEETTV